MPISHESWWIRLYTWAKSFAQNNPVVTATFISGSLGGLTLFWYCLLVGQTPDFTLADITGTFIAACLSGVVILGAFAFTCMAPGAFARYVLDSNLPERPDFSHYWVPDENRPEPARVALREMRATLLEGPFPLELTGLAIFTWSAPWVASLAPFIWPANPALLMMLHGSALVCLLALVCTGTRLPPAWNTWLRIITAFCSISVILLYGFHRLGFPSALNPSAVPPSAPPTLDIPALVTLPVTIGPYTCYAIVITVALIATRLLFKLAVKGEQKRRLRAMHGPQYPNPRPSIVPIRLGVAASYIVFSPLPLIAATQLADANGPAHATRSLAVILLYLAVFNIAFFSMTSVRDNFGKAYLLALGFFVALLLIAVQKPTILPKTVVYALGFGNFHSSLVLLAASECPRLLAYGVQCEEKKDEAIALANVNVINRLGSDATLELLVRREGSKIDDELKSNGIAPDSDLTPAEAIPHTANADNDPKRTLLHTNLDAGDLIYRHKSLHVLSARQCDEVTASWLRAADQTSQAKQKSKEKALRLRCITITVHKEALLDFDKDGWPSYRNGYSEFLGGRALPSQTDKSKGST